jgi:hypothetical protein
MLNISTDFANVVDGAESVTLLRRGSDSDAAGTPVPHAWRRAITTSEATVINSANVRKTMPSGGQYMAGDVVWNLPTSELAVAPRLGDMLLDGAGGRWTILAVKPVAHPSRWRCPEINLPIAPRLDDTITVLKAAFVKSACGAAEPVWQTWRTGIRARIQPAEVKMETDAQSRRSVLKCRIFIAENLLLDQTHRILGADGTTYRIVSCLGNERIGELQVIQAEVAP